MECPDEGELVGFLGRGVTHDRRREIEGHFDGCADCRELAFVLASNRQVPGAADAAISASSQIGRFVVEELIAEGAMGMIYRAHDASLRRDVALKLLRVSSRAAADGGDAHARMLREAQGLARLEHPNVVTVYETGLHGDEVFIAMELIDGVSFDRWLASQRRSWRQIASLLEQAGRGLAAAHAAGLVHRDFKPANIMIAGERRAKVVDFGLARAVADVQPRASGTLDVTTRLTATGTLVGTPAYCAPEQLAGFEVNTASDVFSFCVTFSEAVFGRRPYEAASASELLARMGEPRGPDLPRTPRLPGRLRALLRCGLAFDPAQRPSLDELLAALAAQPARRRAIVLGAAAMIAVAVPLVTVAASNARDEEPCSGSRGELASIWNGDRRAAMRSALLRTQLPFAASTWQHVERALEGYADRWTATHVEACRATAVQRTQSTDLLDRRMACLASRRADLDAAITTLVHVDRDSAREALRVVESIPSVATCNDTSSLLALAPLPLDPAGTVDVAQLRQLLARATALRAAGQYEASVAVASASVQLAERAGYKPLHAEALFARGLAEELLARTRDARESFQAATWAAAASGHTRIEVQALAELALVLRDESPDGRVALSHANHALALLERTNRDPHLEAKVRLAVARTIINSDFAAGQRQHAVGLERLEQAEKTDPVATRQLRIAYEVMWAQINTDRDLVLKRLGALLVQTEQWFGADHPNNATVLWEMADYAALDERHDEARAYATRVAKLLAPYPGHDVLLRRFEAGLEVDPAKRRPRLEAVVTDAEQFYGATSPQFAISLYELGDTLIELGEAAQALPHIERAIAIWQGAYGMQFQMLVHAYVSLAQIRYGLGDLDAAIVAAERAVEVAESNSVMPAVMLYGQMILGELYFRAERYEKVLPAIAFTRDNLDLLPDITATDHMELDFVEAAVLWKLGRDPDGLRRARAIHDKYRAAADSDAESVQDQARWLAHHGRR